MTRKNIKRENYLKKIAMALKKNIKKRKVFQDKIKKKIKNNK